jgi:hypothetical protein
MVALAVCLLCSYQIFHLLVVMRLPYVGLLLESYLKRDFYPNLFCGLTAV